MSKIISYEQSEAREQQSAAVEVIENKPYANSIEKERMIEANPKRCYLMNESIKSLPDLKHDRALDVACGNGYLTYLALMPNFDAVDLFDKAPDAIEEVKEWSDKKSNIDRVDVARMEDYQFEATYTLIALNWCTGYLDDEQLVTFLKKCKAALGENEWPSGCLVVLDNEPDAEICS